MKKILIFLISSISFLGIEVLAATPSTSIIQPLDRIVAVVNNDIIMQSSLNWQVAIIKQQLQMAHQSIPSNSQLRQKVLNQMIDEKLVLQAAAKAKITVTENQLDKAISNIAAQNHLTLDQLKQQLAKQGMNYSTYQKQIHQQLLISRIEQQILGNTIHVSNAEIKAAMKRIPVSQTIPEYHLQALLVPVSNTATPAQVQTAKKIANDIIQQLQQGADVANVAATTATATEPLQGGDMGWKQLSQLPPTIGTELAAAIPGSIVGPLQTANGFYIIKVVATRIAKISQPPVIQSKDMVQQNLYYQKLQQAVPHWVKQLRKTAYIKIINN